jgi:hypothetical protein
MRWLLWDKALTRNIVPNAERVMIYKKRYEKYQQLGAIHRGKKHNNQSIRPVIAEE